MEVWCGFPPREKLFGPIDAVLHYNCVSRIIATLIYRLLLIPTIGYFDEFRFFARTADAGLTLAQITEIITLMVFDLKTEKSPIGENNVFLGLTAYSPQPRNLMSSVISPPRDKAHRWAQLIFQLSLRSTYHMPLSSRSAVVYRSPKRQFSADSVDPR